ncbi:MAG: nickel pincer cofactor biosynthesis protein LarB [Aphanocapsa feldmannii 288cV]|nr:MAG: nickel pincer cofactor biosynthesis protein LarB [Aphanocapsa feldmannii 288cV]
MSGDEPIPAAPVRLGPTDLACLDLDRQRRLGMPEAIWGEHKDAAQIVAILRRFQAAEQLALATRVDHDKAAAVRRHLPQVVHHAEARCLSLGSLPQVRLGPIAVVTGGSSDQVVAAEAALSARCCGVAVERLVDVGVAGLHRLLDRLPQLCAMRVLVVCAGMEGALPTVLAGLLPQPIIGVPVSVGYGVSRDGRVALQGMLASCAPGLTVVNIDNGYGAAMAALRILVSTAPPGAPCPPHPDLTPDHNA